MCECGTSGIGRYGGRIGSQVGDRVDAFGRSLAATAAKRFKSWTGLGDYKLTKNSLIQGDISSGSALQLQTGQNHVRIAYKEYLGDVTTHPTTIGAFNITQFTINPGNEITFPWLSSVAQNFDQYEPRGIIFEFRSTAVETTTGTASLGSIIMASDYDLYDEPYKSKLDMLNSAYSNEAKISDSVIHGIECDPSANGKNTYFVRSMGTTAAGDITDYDICNFYVATQGGGLPAASSIGSLYVHYEFVLKKEQLFNGVYAKGIEWSTYKGETVSPTGYSFSPLKLISGKDIGVKLSSVGTVPLITFPKNLAGYSFRILILYSNNTTAVNYTAPTYTYTNCTQMTTPGLPAALGGNGNFATGFNVASITWAWETSITVNPATVVDATVTTTWPWGTTAAVGNVACVMIQQVATNWNALV